MGDTKPPKEREIEPVKEQPTQPDPHLPDFEPSQPDTPIVQPDTDAPDWTPHVPELPDTDLKTLA